MGLPQGFYRANGPLRGTGGQALTSDPWKNPIFPCFIRYTVAPIGDLYATGKNPSLAPPGWFAYCGPIDLQYYEGAVKSLASYAFKDGYNLIAEPILVHPHSKSYPWPSTPPRCYPWQAETSRPAIYTAYWDGNALRYYA